MLKLCQSRTLFRPFPRVDHAAPFGVFVEVVLGDSAVVWTQMQHLWKLIEEILLEYVLAHPGMSATCWHMLSLRFRTTSDASALIPGLVLEMQTIPKVRTLGPIPILWPSLWGDDLNELWCFQSGQVKHGFQLFYGIGIHIERANNGQTKL